MLRRQPPDPLPIEPYLRGLGVPYNLLLAVSEEPWEDAPRLVLADWLEENGDEPAQARAGFIRLQCRQAQPHESDCPLSDEPLRLQGLVRKEWLVGVPPRLLPAEPAWAFHRGMLERLSLERGQYNPADDGRAFRLLDVRHLTAELGGSAPVLLALLSRPELGRLTSLRVRFSAQVSGDEGARAVASCPYLTGLTDLDLRENGIGDGGARALAASPHLTHLVSLDLRVNSISEAAHAAVLARWPFALV